MDRQPVSSDESYSPAMDGKFAISAQEVHIMRRMRNWLLLIGVVVSMVAQTNSAQATEWGRFYHYPYSYFPQNYLKPFRSSDFDTPYGYPMYPMYMAFPPYYRKDLYYPYLKLRKPGNHPNLHYQGTHFALDIF